MKKRIISIVLLLAMLFALTACTNTPQSTDTADSETDTGTTDTEIKDTSTDSENTSSVPILDHDTNKYEAKYSKDGNKIYYTNKFTVRAPIFTEYYNNYEAAISMTFDDGADLEAARVASDIISKYGLKGTLMLCAGSNSVQNNIDGWKELVAQGHLDVGGHGWYHMNPNNVVTEQQMQQEIDQTMNYLREHFPQENVLTFATPEAHLTTAYLQRLKENGVIANRLSAGDVIAPSDTNKDLFTLASPRMDKSFPPANQESTIDKYVREGKWFIELFHSVRISNDSTDIAPEMFEEHCKWLYDNYNGRVWFASYDDVAKYIAQYRAGTIEYTACDSESMTFVAKTDDYYGMDMTVKIFMPFFIDSAYAIIDGEEVQYLEVKKETNARSVLINIPMSAEGTEIKIVMGGNEKYANNCDHAYVENKVVPPTVAEFGYTEMICTNEQCGHTYKSKYTNKIKD